MNLLQRILRLVVGALCAGLKKLQRLLIACDFTVPGGCLRAEPATDTVGKPLGGGGIAACASEETVP